MPTYGGKKYRNSMSAVDQRFAQDLAIPVTDAIRIAEGNPNYGVLSEQTSDPRRVTANSVVNNMARWREAGSPGKFVDFMSKRWAPIGAKNDPKNLNKNWPGNVRGALKQNPEVDYQFLKDNNIVMSPLDNFTTGAA